MQQVVLWLLGIALVMRVFFYTMVPRPKPVPVVEKPIYGQITAKEWVPAYTSTWYMTTMVGDITVITPMTDYIPDAYKLKVAGRVVWVPKGFFDKAQIGDMYGTPPEAKK